MEDQPQAPEGTPQAAPQDSLISEAVNLLTFVGDRAHTIKILNQEMEKAFARLDEIRALKLKAEAQPQVG